MISSLIFKQVFLNKSLDLKQDKKITGAIRFTLNKPSLSNPPVLSCGSYLFNFTLNFSKVLSPPLIHFGKLGTFSKEVCVKTNSTEINPNLDPGNQFPTAHLWDSVKW